jgi:hypothetical protein
VSTESNLMLASSSVFWTRSTWLDCSRTNCFRVRSSGLMRTKPMNDLGADGAPQV